MSDRAPRTLPSPEALKKAMPELGESPEHVTVLAGQLNMALRHGARVFSDGRRPSADVALAAEARRLSAHISSIADELKRLSDRGLVEKVKILGLTRNCTSTQRKLDSLAERIESKQVAPTTTPKQVEILPPAQPRPAKPARTPHWFKRAGDTPFKSGDMLAVETEITESQSSLKEVFSKLKQDPDLWSDIQKTIVERMRHISDKKVRQQMRVALPHLVRLQHGIEELATQNPEAFRAWISETADYLESGKSLASLPDNHLLSELLILEKTPDFAEQLIGLHNDLDTIRFPDGVSKYKHPLMVPLFYTALAGVGAMTAADALFTADGATSALMYFGNQAFAGTRVADTARHFLEWRGVAPENMAQAMQNLGSTAGFATALGALFLLAKNRSHVLDKPVFGKGTWRDSIRTLLIVAGTMSMMAVGGVVSLGGAVVEGSLGGKEGRKIATESEKMKHATAALPKQIEQILSGIDAEIASAAAEVAKSGYGPKTLFTLLVLGKLTPADEQKFEEWASKTRNPDSWRTEWAAYKETYEKTVKQFPSLGITSGQGLAQAFKALTSKVSLADAIQSLDKTKERGLAAGAATIQDHIAGTLHLDLVGADRLMGAHAFHDKLFLIQSDLTASLNMVIKSLETYEHLQVDDRKMLMAYLKSMYEAGKSVKSNSSTPLPDFAAKLDSKIQIPNLPLTVDGIKSMKAGVKSEPVGIIFQVLDTHDGRTALTEILRQSGYQLDMEKPEDRKQFLLSLMGVYGAAAFAPGILIILTNLFRARRFDRVIRSEFDEVNETEADIADTIALKLQGFMRMSADYFDNTEYGMHYEIPLELVSAYIREKIRTQALEELPAFLEKESMHSRFHDWWQTNYSTPIKAIESLLEFDHTPEDAEIVNAYLKWLQKKTDLIERIDTDHDALVELVSPIAPAFKAMEAAYQRVIRPKDTGDYEQAISELKRNGRTMRLDQLRILAPLVREQLTVAKALDADISQVQRLGELSVDFSAPGPLKFDEQYVIDTYVRAQVRGDVERYELALAQLREAGIDVEKNMDGIFSSVFAENDRVDFRPSQAVLDTLKRHRAKRLLAIDADARTALDTTAYDAFMNAFRDRVRPALDAFKSRAEDMPILRGRTVRIRPWHDEARGWPTMRVEVLDANTSLQRVVASALYTAHPIPDLRLVTSKNNPVADSQASAETFAAWLAEDGVATRALEVQLIHEDLGNELERSLLALEEFRSPGSHNVFTVRKDTDPSPKLLRALAAARTIDTRNTTLSTWSESAQGGNPIDLSMIQQARQFRLDIRNEFAFTADLSFLANNWEMYQSIDTGTNRQVVYDARSGKFQLTEGEQTLISFGANETPESVYEKLRNLG